MTDTKYAFVTGRYLSGAADSLEDVDRLPDNLAVSGSVTFTPRAKYILLPNGAPDPVTILPMSITCELDPEGYLTHNGARGLWLISNDTPANPADWTWDVTFKFFAGVGGPAQAFGPFSYKFATSLDESAEQANDLTRLTPVTSSSGVAMTQGVGIQEVSIEDGQFIFGLTNGNELRVDLPLGAGGGDGAQPGPHRHEIADVDGLSEALLSIPAEVDLSNYATKDSLTDFATTTQLLDYTPLSATESKADRTELVTYAKLDDLNTFATADQLALKADKSQLQDVARAGDLLALATKTELSGYAKSSALTSLAKTTDLATKADKSELTPLAKTVDLATKAEKSELAATKADVASLSQQIPVKSPGYSGAFKDSAGAVAFGILDNGDAELHGAPLVRLPETSRYTYAIADKLGRVAFGVRSDGVVEIGGQPADGKSSKRSPISLTLSDGSGTDTRPSVHVRYPFAPTVNATLKAVHVRNIKDRSGTIYTGALSFNGMWLGSHNVTAAGLTGTFASTPSQLSGAFTTAAGGSEYVVRGLDIPLTGNQDYLLSFGYTCASGQVNCSNVATTWTTTVPSDASALSPSGMVKTTVGPLDVWLEIEHTAPIGAYLGDSIWCGVGNTHPVYTAPGVLHARANGVVPMLYCHSGSAMTGWAGTGNEYKYSKWSQMSKPEYVVWELGRNDLIDSTDVATMRTRFNNLYPVVKTTISPNIYMTTVTPKSDDETSADGIVRRAWNDVIRKELSGGPVRMAFDAARAIERSSGSNIDPSVSADGLHVNTYGSVKLAQSINQPLS